MFKSLMTVVIAISLSACAAFGPAPVLDSNEKRLAAAEITFQEVAELAIRMEPRLSEGSKDKVFGLVQDAHQALVLARAALDVGNGLDFDTQLSTVTSLISVLRPLLEGIEAQEASYGSSIQYTYST